MKSDIVKRELVKEGLEEAAKSLKALESDARAGDVNYAG